MGFDLNLLDPNDPFEFDDGNRPHLYKHLPQSGDRYISVGIEDILDVFYFGNPAFFPTDRGQADWKMMGEVPGLLLVVPLAPSRANDSSKCRPIGVYGASGPERDEYLKGW